MGEKKYRLKYQGKWIKVKRVLGTYTYESYDDPNDVPLGTYTKVISGKSLICEDNDIDKKDIEIVEFEI